MPYSDIIELRGGKAAYSINEEKRGEWETFIPNKQFDEVLRTVLRSVRGNDIDAHKSFWINGTYGTGKSHAASVVSHLLCDEVSATRQWISDEYGSQRHAVLRTLLDEVRKVKRLLPVSLYGLSGITHATDLALVMQRTLTATLAAYDISGCVATDFETYVEQVRRNPELWDHLIESTPGLRSFVADREQLIDNLADEDLATYHRVTDALRENGLVVRLESANMSRWLKEVEELVKADGRFQGMLIVWDEFTDVMTDAAGLSVLKALQGMVEAVAGVDHDTYFLLISHPTAFDKLAADAQKQTHGRYHVMKYNMESMSAVQIMAHKFRIKDAERHRVLCEQFYRQAPELLVAYTATSSMPEQSKSTLRNLFPLHPATANLAAHYATVIGSSSRSVFEFLGQNEAVRDFLSSGSEMAARHVITADYLWDYVLPVFQDDAVAYGAVTERWNSYRQHVTKQGAAFVAVFKTILLLNAFNNVSAENNSDLVTPSEENIHRVLTATQYAADVDRVLSAFNAQGIVQRTPTGLYSVQFSALPSGEIEKKKNELRGVSYKFTNQILKYGDTAADYVRKTLAVRVIRPYSFAFYSDVENNSSLRSQIRNGRRDAKSSSLFFALFFAKDHGELGRLHDFCERATADAADTDMRYVVFVVFDEVLTEFSYEQFIEYQANSECASSHGLLDQAQTHRKNAADLVKEWLSHCGRGNATIYLQGQEHQPIAVGKFSTVVNSSVSPLIFPYSPDAHAALRQRAPSTFWKAQNSQQIVRAVLFSQSRTDMLADITAQMKPVQHLLQDAVGEDMQWLPDVSSSHPLKAVCDKVSAIISHARKSEPFNFNDKFSVLTAPPYGLYGSFASMAMMAVALKPWVEKVFDPQGKPRDANAMVGDISLLFKVWDEKKSDSKLTFRFQTQDEGKLCRLLTQVFSLTKLPRHADISSLKAARYALTGDFTEARQAPLWAVKYTPREALGGTLDITDDIRRLTDNIVRIATDDTSLRDIAFVGETVRMLENLAEDYKLIVRTQTAYTEGFRAFLSRVPKVGVKPEEYEAVWGYVRQHLEATVGYWTEDEVERKVLEWRMEQLTADQGMAAEPITPTPPQPAEPVVVEPSPSDAERKAREQKREKALERINAITSLAAAKLILWKLAEEDSEWLLTKLADTDYR